MITFVVVLMVAIALSNIIDGMFKSFPLPIVQIGFGVVIALSPIVVYTDVPAEIFLGVFVAPLLYRQAETADLSAMWKVRKEVVFLAFALVIVTVFAVGFSLNLFVAAIPLAACCCLGGILGPTDAISVDSVAGGVRIDKKVSSILRGESIINDSSGVISFNFAALALTTGTFSLGDASLSFVLVCAGGFAIGFGISWIKANLIRLCKIAGIKNMAAITIIEFFTPFVCFFAANAIGVSGILAAVTAGTRQGLFLKRVDIFEARFLNLRNSVWAMVTLIFSSFIFIYLGLELPKILVSVYHNPEYSIGYAMVMAALVTVVVYIIRLVSISCAVREMPGETKKEVWKNRMLLTIAGAKGTVSLATAFAIPTVVAGGLIFGQRDLLLLIAALAIVYSIVIPMIVLPLAAKAHGRSDVIKTRIAVLLDSADRLEQKGDIFDEVAIKRFKRRAISLEMEGAARRDAHYRQLRKEFFESEAELVQKVRSGEYSMEEYRKYKRATQNSFDVEREVLAEYEKTGRITAELADQIRIEMNLLENFMIEESNNDIAMQVASHHIESDWESEG
jgi:CPA1 family monovalent cation:H+ antiporter